MRALAATLFALGLDALPAAAKSPRLEETCLTKAEKGRILRYRATDRVRLVALELGRGPRGVVLAHGYKSDICELFVASQFDGDLAADAQTLYDASAARDKRLSIVRNSAAHGSGLLGYRAIRRGVDAFLAAKSR